MLCNLVLGNPAISIIELMADGMSIMSPRAWSSSIFLAASRGASVSSCAPHGAVASLGASESPTVNLSCRWYLHAEPPRDSSHVCLIETLFDVQHVARNTQ